MIDRILRRCGIPVSRCNRYFRRYHIVQSRLILGPLLADRYGLVGLHPTHIFPQARGNVAIDRGRFIAVGG